MGKKSDLESVHLLNHSKCMLAAFQNFRQDETMLDVTLVCNGLSLKAHKLILSASSPLFREMFMDNPCSHPIIILRNYEFCDLKAVIDFMYKGELSVPRERLMSALNVADDLHIRGLSRSERNEPNKERYETMINQVRTKRKRKRQRQNSSDSENEFLNVSDSDQRVIESDESSNAKDKMSMSESQPMDVESIEVEENSTNDKDIRPVVLRVGDHNVSSNEESNSKNVFEDAESNAISSVEQNLSDTDSQKENITVLKGIEGQICDPDSENIASTSHLDSFTVSTDDANILLESVAETEESSLPAEEQVEMPKGSPSEGAVCVSSPCLSPNSEKGQQSDETKLPDEGKRFICSKCDKVFTSRISFMKHKSLGHSNNTEKKSAYKCQQCTFSTEEFDSLKSHLLTHLNKEVPFKCNLCPEEFTSEEQYKQHTSVHESEKITLHDISSASVEDLFPTENRIPEKHVEFRCSICFARFTSKLRCQLHEKTCEGGS